jgi:stage II sporulation protein D
MKKILLLCCVLWLVGVLLPYALLGGFSAENALSVAAEPAPDDGADIPAAEETPEPIPAPVPEQTETLNPVSFTDSTLGVRVMIDGEEETLPLDEYLAGVLAAEMPASFPDEALKAQAVAARSYVQYRYENPPADGVHDGVPLCDNPAHCKGWRDINAPETAAALGANAQEYIEKFYTAVHSTDGAVLNYDGYAALTAFHAISGGRTENSEDVWGGALPYLVSVASPGEESAVKFRETAKFLREDLTRTLSDAYPDAELSGTADTWLTEVVHSDGGSILSAKLGGAAVTGKELRALLSLNSADFEIAEDGDYVEITTTGYGHGVGMSQYGARAMAKEGSAYAEILEHYYPGTTLAALTHLEN